MASTFDFDPQLPALPLAFDLPAVTRVFADRWPRASDPQPIQITRCTRLMTAPTRHHSPSGTLPLLNRIGAGAVP